MRSLVEKIKAVAIEAEAGLLCKLREARASIPEHYLVEAEGAIIEPARLGVIKLVTTVKVIDGDKFCWAAACMTEWPMDSRPTLAQIAKQVAACHDEMICQFVGGKS